MYGVNAWTLTFRSRSRIIFTEKRFLRKMKGIAERKKNRKQISEEKLEIKPIIAVDTGRITRVRLENRMGQGRAVKKIHDIKCNGKHKTMQEF